MNYLASLRRWHAPLHLAALLVLGVSMFWQPGTASAGIYSVRILPSVIQANVGGTFTVDLKANMVVDAAATGKISGSVAYPADLVQLQNVVTSQYPEVTLTTSNGLITVSSPDKGSGNGYGGQQVIFTATFTAIAGGTANFAATNGVMIVNGTNHVVVAGSVTTIGCQPGYTGTYPNCTAPSSPAPTPTPTPAPPATTPAPANPSSSAANSAATSPNAAASPQQAVVIAPQTSGSSSVTVSETSNEVTPTSVHVILQTTAALHNLAVHYGTSKDNLNLTATPNQNGTIIEYEAHGLDPATVYYFKLTGLDSSNKDIGYQTGYQTKGYPVKIKLSGSSTSLASRQVTIDDMPYTTDADGTVTAYLPPNTYTVTDTQTGKSTTITVIRAAIPSGQNPVTQDFSLQLANAKSGSAKPWLIKLSGAAVIAFTAFSAILFWRHHGKHPHAMGHGAWETTPYVPTEKPKPHFTAPAAAAPQSVILPNKTKESADDIDDPDSDDESAADITSDEAAVEELLWSRKTLPAMQGPHTSPYVEGGNAALGAHTKDHRPKIASALAKIKGVRSRTEIKPDSEDGTDLDEA